MIRAIKKSLSPFRVGDIARIKSSRASYLVSGNWSLEILTIEPNGRFRGRVVSSDTPIVRVGDATSNNKFENYEINKP